MKSQYIINHKDTSYIIGKKEAFLVLGTIVAVGLGIHFNIKGNSEENSADYLKKHGYSSVQIGDNYTNCPKHTPLRREFKAIDSKGQEVIGTLCAGLKTKSDKIEIQVIAQSTKPKFK